MKSNLVDRDGARGQVDKAQVCVFRSQKWWVQVSLRTLLFVAMISTQVKTP